MKKPLKQLILLMTVLAIILCAVGCRRNDRNDGMVRYSESGLKFALPKEMEKMSVDYADICYGNGEAEFFVYFYGSDALLTELYLDPNSTVKEYAEWFVNVNDYENVSENYDEENAKIVLEYIYEPENTYFCDYILRNEYALFHVTMCCDAELMEKYQPIFEQWRSHVALDY